MIVQKVLSLRQNKLHDARGNFWEYIVFFWTRSFTVRVTESDPKSRDRSKPSLETESIMLLYCRLKVYEVRMEMNVWFTVSTKRVDTTMP